MESVGGYFELELRKGEHYHKNALCLNTARNSFEYILRTRKYKRVYIPYYTCEVMLQPLCKLNVEYEFYSINEKLEPIESKQLSSDEAFLYTNYYGLKQDCVERLAHQYGEHLIVDNAQAFFAPRLSGIDTFYSARKFFGVPDGSYLYTDCVLDIELEQDKSFERMQHLLRRIDENAEAGYSSFRKNDDALDNQPIKLMSKLTSCILENIDYNQVKDIRRRNYEYLAYFLHKYNRLELLLDAESVPMVYPYFTSNNLRSDLIRNKIFVAQYWPNVLDWTDNTQLEYSLTMKLVPLPIDQRYNKEIINKILAIVL